MKMLQIASQLTYLAFVANYGSIITVLLCFIAMILFIRQFRLYEFESSLSSVVRIRNARSEQCLTKVSLPFSIKLSNCQLTEDGSHRLLSFYSKSSFPTLLAVFHDFSAEMVKSLMNMPWPQLKATMFSEAPTWTSCMLYADEIEHESKDFSVKISSTSISPRSSYAVVIFQIRNDEECSEQDPVGLISLVHLPDQYCQSPATIIGQYLKCFDNRVLNLKPVYSSERDTSIEDTEAEKAESGNADCVVCWSLPASHVLLPCRHACICSNCFKRVENCPVCRTRIVSYFVT